MATNDKPLVPLQRFGYQSQSRFHCRVYPEGRLPVMGEGCSCVPHLPPSRAGLLSLYLTRSPADLVWLPSRTLVITPNLFVRH